MKKSIFNIIAILFTFNLSAQIYYNNNTVGINSSALGANNTSNGTNSFVSGFNSQATGIYSSAIGHTSLATGMHSIALGSFSTSEGPSSVAIGPYAVATSNATGSIVMGNLVESHMPFGFIIGSAPSSSYKFINNISNSLMIGFNSNRPTLFISGSGGQEHTGKIGIGDVTSPLAKLHIKADDGEMAMVFVEPYAFTGAESAKLRLGTMDYGVSAGAGRLYFVTGGNYIFNSTDANVGVGVSNPLAKIQVNGDVFIEDINSGLIMKSPDGNCWRGTLDNSGTMHFVQVDCNNLATAVKEHVGSPPSVSKIYPNPACDMVFLNIDRDLTGVTLQITGVNGEILQTVSLSNADSFIDFSSYMPGIYVFRIVNRKGDVIVSEKIIKQ